MQINVDIERGAYFINLEAMQNIFPCITEGDRSSISDVSEMF